MPAGSDRGISSRYLAFATTFLDPFDFAQGWLSLGMTAICGMRNLATWMRRSDEKYFAPFLSRYPEVKVRNAAKRKVPFEKLHGLLLTGGPDVAPEFLNQPVPDPSLIEKDVNPDRDRWELNAIKDAVERGLPIFAICKGLQTLNVALGGTLHLDIAGHNLPEQKTHDIQPLRSDRGTRHRFEKVNSSHHQAIDKLGAGLEVECLPAHAKFQVPVLEVEGSVRVPDRVVMRERPSGSVGFKTHMAAAVIRNAESELRGDEPARAAAGVADGISRCVDDQVAVFVEDRLFGSIE
jgi:putative glutamine amidotransferase